MVDWKKEAFFPPNLVRTKLFIIFFLTKQFDEPSINLNQEKEIFGDANNFEESLARLVQISLKICLIIKAKHNKVEFS